MHVGVCLNCRYIDLMENVGTAPNAGAVCPRCGIEMTSLGVRTDEWNALTTRQKDNLIREKCPTHDDLFGAEEDETEEAPVDHTEGYPEQPVEGSPEQPAEAPTEGAPEQSSEQPPEEPAEQPITDTADLISELWKEHSPEETPQEEPKEDREPDEFDLKHVYVCYKCNSVAGHDGAQDRYFCADCGSDMVYVGYTVRQWADLSKEAKRKVTEDAKVMHMVSEIQRDDYDAGGPEHTPSIINVVKDPNKAY